MMHINASNEQHYDARKQSLIQQILSYKRRVIEYQQLEKQLQTLTSTINHSQTLLSTRQLTKSPTNISLTNKSPISNSPNNRSLSISQKKPPSQFSSQQTPNLQNKGRTTTQPRRYSSSSKKIKAYELQKKLSRLSKEHNDKFSELMAVKREHEVAAETILQLKTLIQKQHKKTIQLNQQTQSLHNQLKNQEQQELMSRYQLEKVIQRKQVYVFEKASFIDKITSTKLKLSHIQATLTSAQNLNPPGIFSLFNTLSDRQTQRTIDKKNHENSDDENNQSINSEIRDQSQPKCQVNKLNFEGIEYDVIESNSYLSQSYLSPNTYMMKTVIPQQLQSSIADKTQKSALKEHDLSLKDRNALPLKEHNTFPLKDQLQLISEHNQQLNQSIFQLQNHILKKSTRIKHHQLNILLIRRKIQNHENFINREHVNHLKTLEQTELLRKQLSLKQGQRGEIRGKIGIKVEESALIKTLNLTINKDLNHLKDKLNSLILYKNLLCGQLIGNKSLQRSVK